MAVAGMWELIRANKIKSVVLVLVMGVALSALGYLIGLAWFGKDAGLVGVAGAMMVWAILALVSVYGGDSILIGMSGARKIDRSVHPRLWNVVEEMKIAAGLPAMPDIYIIPTKAMNAFATGLRPEKCAVVVTAGLVERLNRDELQGVIAHEMSHIFNRDLLFMTLASVFVGSVVIISQVFLRGTWYGAAMGGGRSRRSSSSAGGGAQVVFLLIALVAAILAPIMVRLMYFAVSRRREYLADATAARLTRYPEGLASALEKIAGDISPLEKDNKVLAPMYIVSPVKTGLSLTSMTSTHPATSERIAILRGLGSSCEYGAYQRAFNAVRGKGGLLPASALSGKDKIPLRAASTDNSAGGLESARAAGDLAYAVGQYAFIACACGLRIKVPPEYKEPTLSCPRCGRVHQAPVADLANVAGMLTALNAARQQAGQDKASQVNQFAANGPTENGKHLPPLKHQRSQTREWETFNCSCGNPLQLSPYFRGDHMTCSRCCRRIDIVDA